MIPKPKIKIRPPFIKKLCSLTTNIYLPSLSFANKQIRNNHIFILSINFIFSNFENLTKLSSTTETRWKTQFFGWSFLKMKMLLKISTIQLLTILTYFCGNEQTNQVFAARCSSFSNVPQHAQGRVEIKEMMRKHNFPKKNLKGKKWRHTELLNLCRGPGNVRDFQYSDTKGRCWRVRCTSSIDRPYCPKKCKYGSYGETLNSPCGDECERWARQEIHFHTKCKSCKDENYYGQPEITH